ncbi:Fe2+-dependent dioxygenase [Polymorphobacter sp.]|uniref:Fe2+-dependent dioxygenase n=1 Tax=Polymorphobacter sp. TaxID=1909290 RepID=UPI003F70A49F
MLHISEVLTADELADVRARIAACDWIDGRATAGHLSAPVKHNRQLAEDDPGALAAAAIVRAALARNTVFAAATLPAHIAPPLFNHYGPGDHYGDHVDNAVRPLGDGRMRLDLSATLFLTDPADYGGGELVIHTAAGSQGYKLDAGDMLLYAAGAVHQVAPVTHGTREACFFWVESLVPSAAHREMLFSLDASIAMLRSQSATDNTILSLTALYHNLVREWARLR